MSSIGKNYKLGNKKPITNIQLTDFSFCIKTRIGDEHEEDISYDIPFAFAFNAFHPDAPIHHVD